MKICFSSISVHNPFAVIIRSSDFPLKRSAKYSLAIFSGWQGPVFEQSQLGSGPAARALEAAFEHLSGTCRGKLQHGLLPNRIRTQCVSC